MLGIGFGFNRPNGASVTTPPVGDVTPPAITSLAYGSGNATFTMSEAATVYLLFSASSTPIAQASFAAAMTAATVKDTFAGSSGANTRAINTAPLAAGTWYLHALGQDSSGNRTAVSVVSAAVTVSASDTTPPAITNLLFSGGNATADMSEAGTVYYLFSASSTPIAQSAFAAAMGSALVSGSFAAAAGTNNATVNTAALTPGTYYFHVIGQDAAGNRTANSVVSAAYVVSSGPALVGSSKIAAINAQSQSIAVPAGIANGHLMLLKLGMKASGAPVTPSGWTLVGSDVVNTGNNAGLFVYKRTAASEPASYTVDSGAINSWSMEMSVYSGASAVSALSSAHSTFTTNLAGPTLTATANSLIEHIGVFDQDSITAPSGTTLQQQTTSAAGYFGLTVAHEGPVSAGTTTARSFTGTTAGSSAVAGVLEIKV